jgi:hypothetical protein
MPAVLNVFFLTIICVAVYLPFLVIWIGVLFVFRVKRKFRYALISLPIFIAGLVAFQLYGTRPSAIFGEFFGFPPPPDVTSIQADESGLGDSAVVYLRFKANGVTVRRITAGWLLPLGHGTPGPAMTNVTPPSWWQPPTSATQFLTNPKWKNYASEEEYILYDGAAGVVYFRFIGVD